MPRPNTQTNRMSYPTHDTKEIWTLLNQQQHNLTALTAAFGSMCGSLTNPSYGTSPGTTTGTGGVKRARTRRRANVATIKKTPQTKAA